MKKIYALFMTLCLVLSATAAPLAGVAKKSYPLYQPEVVKAELALDAMQKAPAATQGLQYDAEAGGLTRYYNETDLMEITTDYVAESGELYIDLMAADQSDYTQLLLFVEDTVEFSIIPEGVYPITNTGATGTAYASQGYNQTQGVIPCAYYPLVEQGGKLYISSPMYFMVSGTVTVEYNEMGIPKITVDALNSNGVAIKVVFEIGGKTGVEAEKVPLKYDATAADGALDYTYGEDAVAETTDKGFYGTFDVADATSMLALLFVYPEGVADAETTIPAGTYTISNSQAAGTVLASSGVSSTGGVGYSFFAKTNAQGQLVPPLYFPVEGTVEVTKVDGGLKVEVNGLNSNDVPVHVVYDATPAEEEEVTVPTNEELWEAFKPYYNEYYGLARADQPIDKVSTFASAKMQEIMTDAASEYKWLGDYVQSVATAAGVPLSTDMASANESGWRWAVHAFFNAAAGQYGAAGIDFTEAGKPENWGPYYLAAQGGTTEPEIEWLEMPLEITNLTTEVMEVEGAKYLQLAGRDDMNDADVMLFLNNYADVDDDYEVNAESSYMTFGGMELTVLEGVMTQTSETDKGTMYSGIVRTYVAEDSLYVAFNLTMYAAPATVLELTDAIVAINEELGTLTFNVPTGEGEGYFVELSGYTAPGVHEGPQICLFETPEVVAFANYVETSVADGVITLKGEFVSPMGPKFNVTVSGNLPEVEEPGIEMVGTVKRAVQNGKEVIVLTHEADGTAHIYQVINGKARAELSQEGVVPVDPENKGSYLAISDIAVTEDGKLVANNYVRNQFAGTTPEAGYLVGTSYYYIWNDLAGDPAVWFTSQTTARSSHGDVGVTFALKGTSTNAELLVTAVHNNNRAVRLAKYNIIDGQYVEPNIPGGQQSSEYYEYFGTHTKEAYYQEAVQGKQFQLNVSPLGEGRWIMDGELVNPSEFVLPAVGENYEASAILTEDLGKKYNGASYVTVGEAVLMVAPFANPDGQLVGAEILNITNGFDAPQYVDMVYVDEAVAATAAATAVEVVEGGLNITLVADAAIHTWFVEMSEGPVYEVYEDAITNLVIDDDNMLLIGGPSDAFQVEVVLGLGDYDRNTDAYQLLPASTISVMGSEATFIDGVASVDGIAQTATAIVHCTWNGMALEFHLTMTSAPLEAIEIIVENAIVEIEKFIIFGDTYDYSLKMTGNWTDTTDNTTYPVLVEVPVYYPEATEPFEMTSTVTVGGMGDNDPWLGFGEGTLTISTVDNVVTAEGLIENAGLGFAAYVSISGTIVETGLENATVTVKPVKVIKNGQLIITKGAAEYNAQGATVK